MPAVRYICSAQHRTTTTLPSPYPATSLRRSRARHRAFRGRSPHGASHWRGDPGDVIGTQRWCPHTTPSTPARLSVQFKAKRGVACTHFNKYTAPSVFMKANYAHTKVPSQGNGLFNPGPVSPSVQASSACSPKHLPASWDFLHTVSLGGIVLPGVCPAPLKTLFCLYSIYLQSTRKGDKASC